MFNQTAISDLVDFIESYNGRTTKEELRREVVLHFGLYQHKKSLFYNNDFAIRFSYTSWNPYALSNTILSLSTIRDFDNSIPLILCIISPEKNILMLMNTTFIRKISHSSLELTENNIVGSFLGQDILAEYNGVANEPKNFELLFNEHLANGGFEWNLERIVLETNNIEWKLQAFVPTIDEEKVIYDSVNRFFKVKYSGSMGSLFYYFKGRIEQYAEEILLVAKNVDNINLRGNIIEYIIVNWEEDEVWAHIIQTIRWGNFDIQSEFVNENCLWDCEFDIDGYNVAVDVKTKLISENHSSSPKIYNIDKFLEFHADSRSVFLLLFVWIDIENDELFLALRSPFDKELIVNQSVYSHWSGRSRRGTVVYNEEAIESVIFREPEYGDYINVDMANDMLTEFILMKGEEN